MWCTRVTQPGETRKPGNAPEYENGPRSVTGGRLASICNCQGTNAVQSLARNRLPPRLFQAGRGQGASPGRRSQRRAPGSEPVQLERVNMWFSEHPATALGSVTRRPGALSARHRRSAPVPRRCESATGLAGDGRGVPPARNTSSHLLDQAANACTCARSRPDQGAPAPLIRVAAANGALRLFAQRIRQQVRQHARRTPAARRLWCW